ncbi:MAG: hypothetical protein U5K38_17200 [Woeseiaceae bacterium]|nr:hypothetical protein [Woeseiaceae bacterium]
MEDNPELSDFDGNGEFGIADVQALSAQQLGSSVTPGYADRLRQFGAIFLLLTTQECVSHTERHRV